MYELAAKLATSLESALVDPDYIDNNQEYIKHLLEIANPAINEHLDHPTIPTNDQPPCPEID